MKIKNKSDLNNLLGSVGRDFVREASQFAYEQVVKNFEEDLYGRKESKYYRRTETVTRAIKLTNYQTTGNIRKRTTRNVYFDYTKLRKRQPVIKKTTKGTHMVQFGAHVNSLNVDQRKNMPKWLEEGYTTFAGRYKTKEIEGVFAFKNAKEAVRNQMTDLGVKAWVYQNHSGIKIQKKK